MGGLAQDPRQQAAAAAGSGANYAPERMIAAPNSNPIVSRLLAGLSPMLIALGNMAGNVPGLALPNGAGGATVTAPAGSLPPALATPPPGGAPAASINPATTAVPTPGPAAPAGSPSMPTVPVSPIAAYVASLDAASGQRGGTGAPEVSSNTEANAGGGPNAS